MAKKKKAKGQPFALKFILITALIVGIGFGAGSGLVYLFRNSSYFRIKTVTIDSQLQFINKRDLKNLIGYNIFDIDLKAVQRRLASKYPQASELKIIKRLPNQVRVAAKQRLPFVQMKRDGKTVILDEDGIVLSVNENEDKTLPLITGISSGQGKVVRGLPFKDANMQTALEIIGFFNANKSLSSYTAAEINVENLSKIQMTLSNDLMIILDRSKNAQKIRVLGVVLSQDKLDLKEVKYIDLRFKEPIIGKK